LARLPVEHPFCQTPAITVLPHIGGLHPQRDTVVAELFVENLKRFLAGQPLLHAVDRASVYYRVVRSAAAALAAVTIISGGLDIVSARLAFGYGSPNAPALPLAAADAA